MLLKDLDKRKKLAYLLNLSPQGYIVKHSRPSRIFIGIAILIGLILAMAYLGQ